MPEAHDTRWLLLIHQIPPKPDYLRVKIWRRLKRVGAVAIKNSVYMMPRSDQSLEDFQWTVREITEGGGDAWICEAAFVEGISNDQVEALFRAARDADYAAISEEAKEFARKFPVGKGLNERAGDLEAGVARLRRRLGEAVGIDFFDCLGRQSAEGLVAGLEARLNPDASGDDQSPPSSGRSAESAPCTRTTRRDWLAPPRFARTCMDRMREGAVNGDRFSSHRQSSRPCVLLPAPRRDRLWRTSRTVWADGARARARAKVAQSRRDARRHSGMPIASGASRDPRCNFRLLSARRLLGSGGGRMGVPLA